MNKEPVATQPTPSGTTQSRVIESGQSVEPVINIDPAQLMPGYHTEHGVLRFKDEDLKQNELMFYPGDYRDPNTPRLILRPNGDVLWKNRILVNDIEIVDAFRELAGLVRLTRIANNGKEGGG